MKKELDNVEVAGLIITSVFFSFTWGVVALQVIFICFKPELWPHLAISTAFALVTTFWCTVFWRTLREEKPEKGGLHE